MRPCARGAFSKTPPLSECEVKCELGRFCVRSHSFHTLRNHFVFHAMLLLKFVQHRVVYLLAIFRIGSATVHRGSRHPYSNNPKYYYQAIVNIIRWQTDWASRPSTDRLTETQENFHHMSGQLRLINDRLIYIGHWCQ